MKKYPLSWFIFLVIVILSLMPIPETPLSDVRFIDKWTHVVMYFGQAITIWYEYLRQHGLRFSPRPHGLRRQEVSRRTLGVIALAYPILLGGVLEVVQETCTHHMRSGDWLDFLADAVGALLAWCVGRWVVRLVKE